MRTLTAWTALISLLFQQSLYASSISDYRNCILSGVDSDAQGAITQTRFQQDHAYDQGWFSSLNFSDSKIGRPENAIQAELFRYLGGKEVAILVDVRGKPKTVSGTLKSVDFSKPKSSEYVLEVIDPQTKQSSLIRIVSDKRNPILDFRVKQPAGPAGDDEFTEFFAQLGIQEDSLKKQSTEFKVYDAIDRLQKIVAQPDTAQWIGTQDMILKMDSNLINGNVRGVYSDWVPRFTKVREAYAATLNAERDIQQLTQLRRSDPAQSAKYDAAITAAQQRANDSADEFGRNYQAVMEAQKRLVSITSNVNCTQNCSINAREVSDTLGLPYPGKTDTSQGMPTREEMAKFMSDHPIAHLAQLEVEREAQIKAQVLAWAFQKPFLDLIDKAVKNAPAWINKPGAIQLLSTFYDIVARKNDFPLITAVLRNKGGVEAQIEQLRGFAAGRPDVLISFSRRVDTTQLWKSLEAQAKTSNPNLYSKMTAADKKAKVMGDLPLFSQVSWPNVVAAMIVTGVLSYSGYEGTKKAHSWFTQLLTPDPSPKPSRVPAASKKANAMISTNSSTSSSTNQSSGGPPATNSTETAAETPAKNQPILEIKANFKWPAPSASKTP